MRSHAGAVLAAAVVALYVGLAALSGHLSPAARGPLLDGLGPAQPYRWASPPPALASTNQQPATGTFVAKFKDGGLQGRVFLTSDAQATVIVPSQAFPPHAGDTAVVLTLTPVDPASLHALPGGLIPFGNAYRFEAAYRPSGAPAPAPVRPIDLVLLYPVTPDLHAATHQIYALGAGDSWMALKGTDTPSVQQTEGKTATFSSVVVAGVPAPAPASPGGSGGGGSSTTTLILVIAVCLLLVGIGLLIRTRGSPPSRPDADA
ncbi:MAG: hypothetical protein ABI828_05330 [Actinomycetota bacterium]